MSMQKPWRKDMKLKELGLKEFKIAYKDMTLQFPTEELKTYETFCELFKNPHYRLFGFYDANTLTGYSVIFEYGEYTLVDYVAILKQFHSKGYGSKILHSLPELFKEKNGCFFEVEKISKTNPQTMKRAKFYTTNGAIKLDINYIYPNNSGGLPMDLYYMSFNNHQPSTNEILDFVKEMFNHLHKDVKNIDKIFAQIKSA